jgi:hypothetical protein
MLAETALLAAMTLVPFGPVSSLLAQKNPYQGFAIDDSDPALLWKVRIEKIEKRSCERWKNALASDHGNLEAFNSKFAPWDAKSLRQIQDCDSFPCAMKLDKNEVSQMAAVPAPARLAKYESLLLGRVTTYLSTGLRIPYEDGDERGDAWSLFEKRGFKSSVPLPPRSELFSRKLLLDPKRIRELRQIVDRRVGMNDHEATLWLRDIYTDHYFDSWSEWASVRCEGPDVVLVQGLAIDLDLLKNTDLLSRIGRPSMRQAFDESAGQFLGDWANRLKREAN